MKKQSKLTMSCRANAFAVAALLLASASVAASALAKPLDTETCQRLKGDIQGLEQQGIRDLLSRGPQAAKGLSAGQLDKVRMLMDLDGQIRFRCGERSFVTLKEEPPEDPQETGAAPATIDGSTPGITLPPGSQSIGPIVPPVKRRPPPPAAKAAAPAPAAGKAQAAPSAPQAPPKAKVAVPAAPAAPVADPAPAPQKPKAAPVKAEKSKPDDAYRPASPQAPGAAKSD